MVSRYGSFAKRSCPVPRRRFERRRSVWRANDRH